MKKLFTFAAAMLASLTMMAQTITLSEVTPSDNWYGVEGVGRVTNKGGNAFSDPDLTCADNPGFKTGSSFFTIQTYVATSQITVGAQSSSNRTVSKIYVSEDIKSSAQSASNVEFELSGGSGDYQVPKNTCGNEFTISFSEPVAANSYIQIVLSGNADIASVTIGSGAPSTDPVESISITGSTTGVVGIPVTLKATAARADTIWWTDGAGIRQESNKGIFTFTPSAAGEVTYTAWAENQYNENPVTASHTVTILSKICGELISAAHTGGKTANVTGVIGGTVDKDIAGDGKFGSAGKYWGLTLASGTFKTGDELNVHVKTAAEQGTIAVYADKTGETLLYNSESVGVAGDNIFVLPAAVDGKSTIYICRTSSNNWNGYVDTISVSRSCVESSDATIKEVYVNVPEKQVFTQDADTFYFNIPYNVGEMTEVTVHFVLNHYGATSNPAESFTMTIPAPGQKAEQNVTVTAQDGTTTKTYVIRGIRNAAQSSDAKLTNITVTGYTLAPEFDSDVYEYTITKAYGTADPTSDLVEYEKSDLAASVVRSTEGHVISLTVTAEDNTTTLVYSITVLEGEAPKSLDSVLFSNGFLAFIDNTNLTVKAYYLEGQAAPTATKIVAGKGTAGALTDGKIIVTGADASTAEYTVTLTAVAPFTEAVAESAAAGVFAGTEAWVKTGLLESGNSAAFDTTSHYYVIRRQLKEGDAANDQRVIAGLVRAYLFVGNASKLELAISGNKKVKYAVDGGAYTEVEADNLSIALTEGNHMIEIVSNQQKGDGRFAAPKLVERGETPEPTYHVTCDGDTENGAVGIEGGLLNFKAGVEITLTNIPDPGYELDEYIVYKTGEPTTLVTVTDGKFTMPAYDVTVSATFKLIPVVEMFTVTLGSYEHGTVAFIEPNEGNKYEAGAEVRLSVTPAEGYELEAISLEGIDLEIPVVDGVASFNMPAQNVTVLATFKQSSGQGFDNIDASMKATKRIINGKLFIEKNGKLYDAQGAIVK